jgi:acyl-CoA reductase-like NAD-dependent aldehyde dehydrogenase
VIPLGASAERCNAENRILSPALLFGVDDTMLVMQQEIFGPILPVKTYQHVSEAIDYIAERPRPLALYYFDHHAERIDEILQSTISGGVTINDVIYHVVQNNLPFGGVGPSGMGCYHGQAGFETFSQKKSVFIQSRFSALSFLRPPYGALSERVIKFLLRK